MSLSFVSSVVQTGTAEGGFEETEIDSKEVQEINKKNANTNKPLFEQLRANQEEEESKQGEMQREMMRGTRALNEEDAAHLDALEAQKQAREEQKKAQTLEELALFRAARVERQVNQLEADTKEDESASTGKAISVVEQKPEIPRIRTPVIVVKNRKRRRDTLDKGKAQKISTEKPPKSQPVASKATMDSETPQEGLGSLLSGYGSSDDSE